MYVTIDNFYLNIIIYIFTILKILEVFQSL